MEEMEESRLRPEILGRDRELGKLRKKLGRDKEF